jgi:hypothetical protein
MEVDMQAQSFLKQISEEKIEHKRRKQPVVLKLFTMINKSATWAQRNSGVFQTWWKTMHGPRKLSHILASHILASHILASHIRPSVQAVALKRTHRDRKTLGPVMVFTTLHMLRRAMSAGWEYVPTPAVG